MSKDRSRVRVDYPQGSETHYGKDVTVETCHEKPKVRVGGGDIGFDLSGEDLLFRAILFIVLLLGLGYLITEYVVHPAETLYKKIDPTYKTSSEVAKEKKEAKKAKKEAKKALDKAKEGNITTYPHNGEDPIGNLLRSLRAHNDLLGNFNEYSIVVARPDDFVPPDRSRMKYEVVIFNANYFYCFQSTNGGKFWTTTSPTTPTTMRVQLEYIKQRIDAP